MDAATSAAIRKFQAASGLTQTGKLGALTLQKLGFGSEVAGKSAPMSRGQTEASRRQEESMLLEPDPEEGQEAEALEGAPEP
jgi:hypothetical protein